MASSAFHERIADLRRKNPCLTLQAIADRCGITRQAVNQHLIKEGLPTKGLGSRHCHYCKRFLRIGEYKLLQPRKNVSFKHYCCFSCWDIIKQGKTIMLSCDVCGVLFHRSEKQVIQRLGKKNGQHIFCSKKCQGKWFSQFGFQKGHKRYPKIRKRKYDYQMVWEKHLETGYGALRLSRMLDIPKKTIEYILGKMEQ